ncbi:MAG: ATP-binding protein [Clostridiales bacterium]|nr:ATP-binding protein [Clostridiales bacterium]
MTKRIFRSVCIVAVAVLLASLTLVMGVLYDYFSGSQEEQLKNQTVLAAQGIENEGAGYFDGLKSEDLRITWIDKDGKVLFDNRTDASSMENHLEREEVREAVESGYGTSARYSETLTEKSLYSAKKLSDGSIVRLSVSQYSVITLFLGMLRPVLFIALLAVILALVLAYRLSKNIVTPLNKLDLDAPLSNEVYEELSPLLQRMDAQQKQLKSQAKELERKREEFEAATANMSEGLVVLNEHGEILSVNRTASDILGTSDACLGKDILSVNGSAEMQEMLRQARTGENAEITVSVGGRDFRFNASPVVTEKKVAGIALLIFDITEKEKAEQMRREFTANVSHELKTPLHTISGYAELLANGMVEEKDTAEFSQKIYAEAQRMIRLVEDIIRLSNLDEGATELAREEADLCKIAKKAVESLAPAAEKENVSVEFSGEKAELIGIPQLLSAIVYNLTDNAIKYNHSGGKVFVSVTNVPDGVLLSVKDTGIGIPKDQQERVFERFYRVDKSHSKEVGGTGLGLSIVKHAAKLHGAKITLDSEPGKGTEIAVLFPKSACDNS